MIFIYGVWFIKGGKGKTYLKIYVYLKRTVEVKP